MGAPNDPAPAAEGEEQGGSKRLLRFITCGSVDDGKSTLIGRCSMIPSCCSTTS